AVPVAELRVRPVRGRVRPAVRADQLPERPAVHAVGGDQARDRPAAPAHRGELRDAGGRGRAVLPGAAAREPGAVPPLPGTRRRRDRPPPGVLLRPPRPVPVLQHRRGDPGCAEVLRRDPEDVRRGPTCLAVADAGVPTAGRDVAHVLYCGPGPVPAGAGVAVSALDAFELPAEYRVPK